MSSYNRYFFITLLLFFQIANHPDHQLRASASNSKKSCIFLTDHQIDQIRTIIGNNSPQIARTVARLRNRANEALNQGPWSVTFHKSKAVSKNSHDYYSEGPYWWPDPADSTAPFIRRDGEVNPAHFTAHRQALNQLCEAILTLGMAGYFLNEKQYVDRAAKIIYIWFISPETKMNPHLEYGQAIFGRTTGRGIGIIDTRPLIQAIQGFQFLARTGWWPAADQSATKQWVYKYLKWLTTNSKGLDEKMHGNNHSTWWAAQVASFALYVEDEQVSDMIWDHYRNFLIPHQIKPDGSCPLEEARTKSLSYSVMNLDGISVICRLAQIQGIDLWHYQTPEGAGIQKSINYLLPYILNPESWDKQQISAFHPHRNIFLIFAAAGLTDQNFVTIFQKLPEQEMSFAILLDLFMECCF
ncbi:alginate lyase family protein [candidate division KSB1 bacterium]|nr:alginate lyase family protein [candidate division KSB1 bacterium]